MQTPPRETLLTTLMCAFLFLLSSCNTNNEATPPANAQVKEEAPSLVIKYPLITWPLKTPVEIGCMLEQELGYKDSVFNCSYKNYENKGDPCKKIIAYYEGIQIPDALASKVDSSIAAIALDFEHGNLREISITFKDSMMISNVIKQFNLPLANAKFPDNIMAISYGDSPKQTNQTYIKELIITGFEHMGAGDVDCN